MTTEKVVLVTGAARRVGAKIVQVLHAAGWRIILHFNQSVSAAEDLQQRLNAQRADSVQLLCCDLTSCDAPLQKVLKLWGRLDALVNNASVFFPTPVDAVDEATWSRIMDSNVKAPFFLAQQVKPLLELSNGCIINITDIHAERPLKNHVVYSVSKAALLSLTQSLARELAPTVRVNAVSPGAILWPEEGVSDPLEQQAILAATALKRLGSPLDIANTVKFLLQDAPYITGQVVRVDGGRSLNQ